MPAPSLAASLSLLLLFTSCTANDRPSPALDVPAAVAPSQALRPAALPTRILDTLVAREYEASPDARGLQAPNRAQGLRVRFERTGIRLQDRTRPDGSELVSVSVAGVGRAGALAPLPAGELAHDGPRVEIRRPGLVEWYVNGPDGLEQGFTLELRPHGSGPLRVELVVAAARVTPEGEGARLTTAGGRQLLYQELAAFDATGRRLRTRMEVRAPDRVQLVVEDAAAAYPVVIDPIFSEASDARLQSEQAGADFGWSVARAGDVNDDGYADVIVGAPLWDGGEADEGAAFVFLGGPAGIASGGPGSAAARIESDQAGAALGEAVAGAGDVNGDGYDDVVVGAAAYDAGQADEGAAWLFLGGPSGIASGSPATADAQLESDQASASFGDGLAGADVNGDSYSDVIVGARAYDDVQADRGAIFVFHGSAAGLADGNPGSADAQRLGVAGSLFGWSVARAGDVDADGYDDVVVGAEGHDAGQTNEGAAFVFRGGATGIASTATTIQSNQTSAGLGIAVDGAGDVNGDGYDDLIVGAWGYNAPSTDEGSAFVYHGSAAGIPNGSPLSAAAHLQSDAGGAQLGTGVAGAGDVNADGYDDVIAGAPFAGPFGRAYVFLGGATGIAVGGPSGAAALLSGEQTGDQFGVSVAGVGDVNGDGYDDVVVGDDLWDFFPVANQGAAFVYLGGVPGVCSDSLDNDGDGLIDYPADVGCLNARDPSETPPECNNGLDDDGDGETDHPDDPGCASLTDEFETSPTLSCDDGLDDDDDGFTDYPDDIGCHFPNWIENPMCQDGINNDGQLGIDFDGGASRNGGVPLDVADPNCPHAWVKREKPNTTCGLGFEAALALAGLELVRRHRGRHRG